VDLDDFQAPVPKKEIRFKWVRYFAVSLGRTNGFHVFGQDGM
jgi:hypothetical protein